MQVTLIDLYRSEAAAAGKSFGIVLSKVASKGGTQPSYSKHCKAAVMMCAKRGRQNSTCGKPTSRPKAPRAD